jgi:hypothetical protein
MWFELTLSKIGAKRISLAGFEHCDYGLMEDLICDFLLLLFCQKRVVYALYH